MRRSAPVLACLVVWLGAGAAHADRANRVTVDVSEELGVVSATHTTVTAGYTRRLMCGRAYVEGRVGVGTTGELGVVEGRAGGGLVLWPARPVELLIGWRVGDTYMRGELFDAPFRINLLAVELAVTLQVAIGGAWRLRMSPLAPTLFWNRTYGGSLGLELGVDVAL